MHWVIFVVLTISLWGLYGVMLHEGVQGFSPGTDPNARYKAFLFVGIAYFITAVLAPLLMLWLNGASWDYSGRGMRWSLLAGVVGAIGAFGVLLAFGAGGKPAVVMSLIFAFAPIINAVAAMVAHPPDLGAVRWPFVLGIVLAAVGGGLVYGYKPKSVPPKTPLSETIESSAQPSATSTAPPTHDLGSEA